MKHVALLMLVLCTACAHGTSLFRKESAVRAESVADSMYWGAISQLDPTNKSGSRDTAITLLETYLKTPVALHHVVEARTFLAMARDADQLARVQVALQQTREKADAAGARADSGNKKSDDDAAKEITRLRRYLSDRGKILPRRMTGTCARHQRRLTLALTRARHIALLPFQSDVR
jgi:ribosomal protein S18